MMQGDAQNPKVPIRGKLVDVGVETNTLPQREALELAAMMGNEVEYFNFC